MPWLLVAPENKDLPDAGTELQNVVNYLRPGEIMSGRTVTVPALIKVILTGAFTDFWFLTHGVKEGIHLVDGLLPAELLSPLLGQKAQNVFLNTCNSVHTANIINQATGANLVCTITEVPDLTAFLTGTQLAFHLGKGLSFRQAYELSKPANNTDYVFLAGKSTEAEEPVYSKMVDDSGRVATDLFTLRRDMDRMKQAVYGDPETGSEGVLKSQAEIRKAIQNIYRALLAISIAIGLIFVIILIFWLQQWPQ